MLIKQLPFLLVAVLLSAQTLLAQADTAAEDKDAPKAAAELPEFTGDANSADDLQKYAGEVFGDVARVINDDPDAAEAKLTALEKFLAGQKIEDPKAQAMEKRATAAITFFRSRLTLARTSLADLKKQLEEKPDVETVQNYIAKVSQDLGTLSRTDPIAADKQLGEAKEFLKSIADKSDDEDVQTAVERSELQFARIERSIASEKRLAELIGKEAAPLAENVEAWANGKPLTDADLKGKVVLLDFWAVWCGPCIATFPHLREWNEKYSKEGLVIVGLTRFYNYTWDDDANRAKRSAEEVSSADELAALDKFAESYELTQRFAVQKDRTLSDYYAVSGIPHVVLIGRDGKVRLVKVGAGEANAKAIEEEIQKLLAE